MKKQALQQRQLGAGRLLDTKKVVGTAMSQNPAKTEIQVSVVTEGWAAFGDLYAEASDNSDRLSVFALDNPPGLLTPPIFYNLSMVPR